MNIRLRNSLIFLLLMLFPKGFHAQPIHWPVDKGVQCNNIECLNTVNCTFGEIHPTGTDHFHGAIDIDCPNNNTPIRAVESGIVLNNANDPLGHVGIGNSSVVLEHNPVVNETYIRRSKYLHIVPNSQGNLALGKAIAAQTHLGIVTANSGGHLHFELYQYDLATDTWYKINPLSNDVNWEFRYHQELEGREDSDEPQVDNVIVQANTGETAPGLQPNGVASGFEIYTTTGGLSHIINGTQYPNLVNADITNIHYPDDQLIVFGNIGLIANARDIGINAMASSGRGLTVKQLSVRIDKQSYQIDDQIKYAIDFDRISFDHRNSIDQVFHTDFNTPIEGDPDLSSSSDRYCGNNDFVELQSSDDTYLFPHKPILSNISSVQSNGIWFTKARGDTEHVFRYTPDDQHIAGSNIGNFSDDPLIPEAKYPDGEYTLKFFAQDDYGHVNRDDTGRDVDAQLNVIVDNFRPYVKDVKITSGPDTFPMYSSAWNWETATRELKLRPNAIDKKADMGQPLHIAVTTSEPMKLTTDGEGQPNGSMKIKLFARDPDDPDRMKVSIV